MPFTTLTIDSNYGYVLAAATSTYLMNMVHGFNTGKYRKAAGIAYPACYADNKLAETNVKAYQFNCAQRSHANFIEQQPSTVAVLLIAGLQYPLASAALGAAWTVSRYLYMVGYCKSDLQSKGKGRYMGISHALASMALFVMAGVASWKIVAAGL